MYGGMLRTALSKAKFLIVDDEASNVRLLERLLELAKAGPVFSVTDPRKALGVFLTEKPDIVLLDLHMPQLDGFALLSQIKATRTCDVFLFYVDAEGVCARTRYNSWRGCERATRVNIHV